VVADSLFGRETTVVRHGFLFAIGAYTLWGFSPVVWKSVEHVPAVDIFGHRLVWTFVCVFLIVVLRRSLPVVFGLVEEPRVLLSAFVAAVLLASNWLLWIWAVTSDRVVEGSLGYFMNPLVSVVLGVIFLGESLRSAQRLAVLLATMGVVWLTVQSGTLPWIALVLAFTFGFYGLIKKKLDLPAFEGLSLEMSVLFFPAVLFLVIRAASGYGSIGVGVPRDSFILIAGGAFTAVPLLLFGAAARRVPLAVVGLTQYLAPTISFILGVAVYSESFDRARLVGFTAIWVALAVFSVDFLRSTSSERSID